MESKPRRRLPSQPPRELELPFDPPPAEIEPPRDAVPPPPPEPTVPGSPEEWAELVAARLKSAELHPLEAARRALEDFPGDGGLIQLAAYAALVEEKPDRALPYVKKMSRIFFMDESRFVCQAIAYAQQGGWPLAQSLLERYHLQSLSYYYLPWGVDRAWVRQWMHKIARWRPQTPPSHRKHSRAAAREAKAPAETAVPAAGPAALPAVAPRIATKFALPDEAAYEVLDRAWPGTVEDFLLRRDLAHLALLQSFDQMLCLGHVRGVDHYDYQVETVRKVLKQFHGRVLLADEVGLGKTIEAGMILKEYVLRGMVRRVLVLTPASLVGQWQEELATKFDMEFATTQDPLLQRDPAAFWSQPYIVASIATARREPHWELLAAQEVDLVVADEAHHLKNRASKNWKLVDALKKRFLLLLSATPVENNLVELFNLLTLLKPGIFNTERDFRALFVASENPRLPANRDRLRELMRDAMVRNTRALVDVRLPPRTAVTIRAEPSPQEAACYHDLSRLVRELPSDWARRHSPALRHLLEAAGSSPRTARPALERLLEHDPPGDWAGLCARYAALDGGAKARALMELLERNPSEKKIVFVRFRETFRLLEELLDERGTPHAAFEGSMTGSAKDAAIERFRTEAAVLVSTEGGGEGRNIQFCNTLINFDLPWNPQLIEQRIGRIHRIGQTREVFIFNLAARGTVEDRILGILDEKINMFELVVGEIQSILGEMDEDRDFAAAVFAAWAETTETARETAFSKLEEQLVAAHRQYEEAKALDDEVFGEGFEAV